jgi:four helix bundle protein
MTAKSFEEMECWKAAVALDAAVYRLFKTPALRNEFELKGQMLRSAGSVADNIAEGFERGGNKEFIQYLFIAKGSCGELRSQFHRAMERQLIDVGIFSEYLAKCRSVSGMLGNLISHLKESDFKGNKYV